MSWNRIGIGLCVASISQHTGLGADGRLRVATGGEVWAPWARGGHNPTTTRDGDIAVLAPLHCEERGVARVDGCRPGAPATQLDCCSSALVAKYVGPYLVKYMSALLTLTDRILFDAGVMPPGSYSSARYLLTGGPKLVKRGLWPWSTDPQGAHHHIDQLARLEGCDWQDTQAALCQWAP